MRVVLLFTFTFYLGMPICQGDESTAPPEVVRGIAIALPRYLPIDESPPDTADPPLPAPPPQVSTFFRRDPIRRSESERHLAVPRAANFPPLGIKTLNIPKIENGVLVEQTSFVRPRMSRPKKERLGNVASSLRADLKKYHKKASSLDPKESAKQWLSLYDRQEEAWWLPATVECRRWMHHEFSYTVMSNWEDYCDTAELNEMEIPVNAREVLLALPPPKHWPELCRQIRLRSDPDADTQNKPTIQPFDDPRVPATLKWRQQGLQLLAALLVPPEDQTPEVQRVLNQLKDLQPTNGYGEPLSTLLRWRLTGRDWQGDSKFNATVTDHDAVTEELYLRGMSSWLFSLPTLTQNSSPERIRDLQNALKLQLRENRLEEARRLLKQIEFEQGSERGDIVPEFRPLLYRYAIGAYGVFAEQDSIVRQRYAQLMLDDCAYEDRPVWEFQVAVLSGKFDDAISVLKKVALDTENGPEQQLVVHAALIRLLFRADRTEEATEYSENYLRQLGEVELPFGMQLSARELANIANRLNIDELRDSTLRIALEDERRFYERQPNTPVQYSDYAITKLLLDADQGEKAIELAKQQIELIQQQQRQKKPPAYANQIVASLQATLPYVLHLMEVYHSLGHHQQVVDLIEDSPLWPCADLVDMSHGGIFIGTKPLGYFAASSFAAIGERDKGLRSLDALFYRQRDFDPAFKLLIHLEKDNPQKVIARLDAMIAADPFEDRPLIWKAKLLIGMGKFAEAEAAARRAIEINPADEGQPRGDRMRAYAVLAEVLERQGKKEVAKPYQKIVKAIRIAEDADRFAAAKLTARAVTLYREALLEAPQLYCVHLGLASQLRMLSQYAESEKHFRRGFELMPQFVGRKERQFLRLRSLIHEREVQRFADESFNHLLKASPTNPRVHFSVGLLRMLQDRNREACLSFCKSAELDPNCVNTWLYLRRIPLQLHNDPPAMDLAVLNLLRLDPWSYQSDRCSGTDDRNLDVTDLQGLWRVVNDNKTSRLARPAPVEVFLKAKDTVAKLKTMEPSMRMMEAYYDERGRAFSSPNEAIVHTPSVQRIISWMDSKW
ncbi:MAG: hypothetical protein SGJ20_05340 [Planctomycetota bacterium]|nr:hypothetical protein [Planctomycetota bacterium]